MREKITNDCQMFNRKIYRDEYIFFAYMGETDT